MDVAPMVGIAVTVGMLRRFAAAAIMTAMTIPCHAIGLDDVFDVILGGDTSLSIFAPQFGDDDYSGIKTQIFYVPSFAVNEDKDDWMPPGAGLNADVAHGSGRALRVSMDRQSEGSAGSFGVFYLNNRHSIKNTEAEVRAHSLYLELLGRYEFGQGTFVPYAELAAGAGGMIFDFSSPKGKSRGGGALELRFSVGLRISKYFNIEAGAGQYFWGYPGETIGLGGFTTLGLGFKF